MRSTRWLHRAAVILVVTAASVLAACGGGGGGGSVTPPAPTPTPTPTPINGGTSAPTLPPIPLAPQGSGWGPYAVANAFSFPVQSGYNGTGVTIAVVGDATPAPADLTKYITAFGITRSGTYTVVPVDGGPASPDPGGKSEATLDVETVEALAPGANVSFYAVKDLSGQSFLDAYNRMISDGTAKVASVSFGGCEDPSDQTIITPVLAQAAATGLAFIAAAGDQGDECAGNTSNVFGVNYPASDPNVIGVGGTETYPPPTTIASTVAWNDSLSGNQMATGGGVSTVFTIPAYQAGLAGAASVTNRNVPDIAMPAVDVGVYEGGWSGVLGTSWSAPEAAALVSEIYEYCKTPLANPVTLFYRAFAANQANFLDVLTGNNRIGTDPTFYSASAGFDNVSGTGVPKGMSVANAVCPNRVPLAARGVRGMMATESEGLAQATQVAVVPDTRRLADLGDRAASQPTRIAIVLRATPNLAANESKVTSALRNAGFTIVGRYSNHLVIDAQANASVVASYFGTRLRNFSQGKYGIRFANVSPLVAPATIAPYVRGILANDLQRMFRI